MDKFRRRQIWFSNANGGNVNGENYVGYCFTSVPGFSRIGTYQGNGSTNGTYVFIQDLNRPQFYD